MKLTDRIFVKFFYKKIKIIIQRSYKKGYSQGIRDKENLVGILQSHVSSLSHGVYLEERIEVHELDSGLLVYPFHAEKVVPADGEFLRATEKVQGHNQ